MCERAVHKTKRIERTQKQKVIERQNEKVQPADDKGHEPASRKQKCETREIEEENSKGLDDQEPLVVHAQDEKLQQAQKPKEEHGCMRGRF